MGTHLYLLDCHINRLTHSCSVVDLEQRRHWGRPDRYSNVPASWFTSTAFLIQNLWQIWSDVDSGSTFRILTSPCWLSHANHLTHSSSVADLEQRGQWRLPDRYAAVPAGSSHQHQPSLGWSALLQGAILVPCADEAVGGHQPLQDHYTAGDHRKQGAGKEALVQVDCCGASWGWLIKEDEVVLSQPHHPAGDHLRQWA